MFEGDNMLMAKRFMNFDFRNKLEKGKELQEKREKITFWRALVLVRELLTMILAAETFLFSRLTIS